MLQDERALRRLADEIGQFAGDRGPHLTRFVTRWLGRELGSDLVALVRGRERQHPEEVLTDAGRRGLLDYLAGPVALQFERENAGRPDASEVSFIFGHTHKPFESRIDVPGFPNPLSVYNSGGWVVDASVANPHQGASVLLVDAACNVTSLRMTTKRPCRLTMESDCRQEARGQPIASAPA